MQVYFRRDDVLFRFVLTCCFVKYLTVYTVHTRTITTQYLLSNVHTVFVCRKLILISESTAHQTRLRFVGDIIV